MNLQEQAAAAAQRLRHTINRSSAQHKRAVRNGFRVYRGDFIAHIVPVVAEHLADIDHHVDFLRTVQASLPGFGHFDGNSRSSVRETDHGSRFHRASLEPFGRLPDGVGLDAYRCGTIFKGQRTSIPKVFVGHGGMQERMVDHLGERLHEIGHRLWICVKWIDQTGWASPPLSSGRLLPGLLPPCPAYNDRDGQQVSCHARIKWTPPGCLHFWMH